MAPSTSRAIGRRYELALAHARAAAAGEGTVERWETAGDIAFHLHRFRKSREAYRPAAALSEAGDIRLRAGYALKKTKDLAHAADFFSTALDRSACDNAVAYWEAFQVLGIFLTAMVSICLATNVGN